MIRDTNQGALKSAKRMGRLGDAGTIVSASITNCTDMDGNPLPCPDFTSTGATTSAGAPASSGPSLFTSSNAFASGTGLGPINLPSFFSSNAAGTIETVLIIAAAVAFLYLWTQRR